MTIAEIEQIYAELVQADEETPESDRRAKHAIQELKAEYHQLLLKEKSAVPA